MSLDDYRRQQNAMDLPFQRNLSPFRESLEQLLDTVVRRDREGCLGVSYGHCVGEIGA